MEQVDNFGVYDYSLRVKALKLAQVDKQRDMHWQAMLNRNVQAANKKGEYIYPEFKDFFDERKYMDNLDDERRESKRERFRRLSEIAKQVNTKGG